MRPRLRGAATPRGPERLAVAAVTALLALWPAAARACAVCGANADRNGWAYAAMTAVMSILPLGLFAAGGLWLRRGMRRAAAEDERGAEPR